MFALLKGSILKKHPPNVFPTILQQISESDWEPVTVELCEYIASLINAALGSKVISTYGDVFKVLHYLKDNRVLDLKETAEITYIRKLI